MVLRMGPETTTDVKKLWETAIRRYEEGSGRTLESLPEAKTLNDVLSEIQIRKSRFESRRHSDSKLDRLRDLVKKCLQPVEKLSEMVAQASSSVSLAAVPRHNE